MNSLESMRPTLRALRSGSDRVQPTLDTIRPALETIRPTLRALRPALSALATTLALPTLIPRLRDALVPRLRDTLDASGTRWLGDRWAGRWSQRAARRRSAMLGAVALTGVMASLAVAYVVYDLNRRRAEMSAGLRARVTGALRAEPTLAGLPVVVDVHSSLRRDSPLTLEIAGTVPTAEIHDAVLQVVAREVARTQPDAGVDDRIVVDPSDFGQAHMVAPPRTLE